ncbi:hypothetical protein V8E36_008456 [Tilletia maclaganii]
MSANRAQQQQQQPGSMGPPPLPSTTAASGQPQQHTSDRHSHHPDDPMNAASSSSSTQPTRAPPKKRNRAALSCTACRERKIKCSRQIPCEQCIKRGDEAFCKMAPHPKDAAAAAAAAGDTSTSSIDGTPTRAPRPRPPKKPRTSTSTNSNSGANPGPLSADDSLDLWHKLPAGSRSSATSTGGTTAAFFPPNGHLASLASPFGPPPPFGGLATSVAPAAAEFAAIKERLAQLEASLAQAQMHAAHSAALAAAAGVRVDPLAPPPPAPAPAPAPAPGNTASTASSTPVNYFARSSYDSTAGPVSYRSGSQSSQRSQQQQQQQQAQDAGEGVDSDTEDAAAVLEGLAFCGTKKDTLSDKLTRQAQQAQPRQQQQNNNNGGAQRSASSSGFSISSSSAGGAGGPLPAAFSTSSLSLSAISTSDPTSSSSATSPATAGQGRDEPAAGSLRDKEFRHFLEADKQRDLMLPDGMEPPEDESDMDDDEEDDEEEEEHDEIEDESMDVGDSARGPGSNSTSAASSTKKKNYKSAQRLMSRSGKMLSAAYKDAASMARSQVAAQQQQQSQPRGEGVSQGKRTGSSLATSAAQSPEDPRSASAAGNHPSGLAAASGPQDRDGPGSTSSSKDNPSATLTTMAATTAAATAAAATHIRGPTAEAYDLSRAHQGLFRVIVHGESMLGFGLGWPFAAAAENGDYKVIKGIGACPGNTQREAVLRAIIRTIPQREVVDQLLSVWEENVSFLAGKVIHVPTLRKEMETFFAFDSVEKRARVVSYVDPGWLAVLLMVFVTAMQFWPCNSSKSPSIFDGRSQSMWYAAAKSALVLARYQSSQSLSVLQSIILINLHAQEPGRVQTALMRTAINNAMDLRLHRLGDADKALTYGGSCPGPCQFVRRQIELRIWWALVFRDWTSSACTSTYIINPDYFNTPMPANLNEHELCQSPTPQAHPPEVATEMSYVLANIELAKAVRISTDLSNRASIQSAGKMKSLRAEDVSTLDTIYREVLSNAPPFFRAGSKEGEGTNLEVQRWLFVQAVFHKLLNLHRPRISSRTESRVVCVLLARSILDMQSKLRQRCCVVNRLCHNLLMSFSAASLLCLDLLQSPALGMEGADPVLRLAIRAEVGEALEALRSVAEENHTAQRMYRIIEALLAEEEHRWNTVGSSTSAGSTPAGAHPDQQGAHGGNAQRKRSDPSLHSSNGGFVANDGGAATMTGAQRKKELLRLAKRVAEAAQEQIAKPGQGCPLADHAAKRTQQAREASVGAGLQSAAGPSSASGVNSGVTDDAAMPIDGSGGGPAAFAAAPAGPQGGGPAGSQPEGQASNNNPFIMPTPSLAEHPYFTNKDVSSFTAPTQPTFANQNVAVAPNGMDFQAPPQSQLDAFSFDVDSFIALMNSQQSPTTLINSNNGGTMSNNANGTANSADPNGLQAAAEAAVKWFTETSAGTKDNVNGVNNFGYASANPVLPSPSASASSSKVSVAAPTRARTLGADGSLGPLPTPPQSDSAGSSSGQSPPATGADAGAAWFWNWVLEQGTFNHAAPARVDQGTSAVVGAPQLPVLQQIEDRRREAAAAANGFGGAQVQQQQAQQYQQLQPQQQEQQYLPQQQQQQTNFLSTSPDFLTVPPIPSAAGPKTPAEVRHLPSTPSSYFSSHFFTPNHVASGNGGTSGGGANGAGGGGETHHSHGNPALASLAANANVGTPSSNLSSSGSGSGSGFGSGGVQAQAHLPTTNGQGSGVAAATANSNGSGTGGGGFNDDAFGQIGVWMQAPSLFDYADGLGIAEGGSNISPDAGYLASLFVP